MSTDTPGQLANEGEQPQTLEATLAQLEADPAPRDESHFAHAIDMLARAIRRREETPTPELAAEEMAWLLRVYVDEEGSPWGTYFGPIPWGKSPEGEPTVWPAPATLTPDVFAYWRRRATATPHPIMRARYADLLWELPRSKQITSAKRDAEMARLAVTAYLDAVDGDRYKHAVSAIAAVRRALSVALSVKDSMLTVRAQDVLLALEDRVAEDDMLGLWGFCFDTLLEPPQKRVPLEPHQRDKLVTDLEDRLARFAAGPAPVYHPAGPEIAALRLARHYARQRRRSDVTRVLRVYRDIVLRMRGTAAPMVVEHSLWGLHELLATFQMYEDAEVLDDTLRAVGEETLADMRELTVEGPEIPAAEFEAHFAAMLAGTPREVLQRIAAHYVPDRSEMEDQVREASTRSPLHYLTAGTLKDAEGRTTARLNPLSDDPASLEGHVLHHISENLRISAPWLRTTMQRGAAAGLLSVPNVLDFLLESPLFPGKRRAVLQGGVEAYVRGDSVAAVHVLVTQVEPALRQLAVHLGASIYGERSRGGVQVLTLDALLQRPQLGEILGVSIVTYLRALLTDPRGWNVRNVVCHGLAPMGMLTMPVADRVVHALLVLALVRQREEPAKATDGGNTD